MKVAIGATLADIGDELFGVLGVGEEAAKKAKCFLGQEWVRFAPRNALKETDHVYGERCTLYVVLDPKRPTAARYKEEMLKIDS
jgi:hypothetical protein